MSGFMSKEIDDGNWVNYPWAKHLAFVVDSEPFPKWICSPKCPRDDCEEQSLEWNTAPHCERDIAEYEETANSAEDRAKIAESRISKVLELNRVLHDETKEYYLLADDVVHLLTGDVDESLD